MIISVDLPDSLAAREAAVRDAAVRGLLERLHTDRAALVYSLFVRSRPHEDRVASFRKMLDTEDRIAEAESLIGVNGHSYYWHSARCVVEPAERHGVSADR